jgi:hypothetical protein
MRRRVVIVAVWLLGTVASVALAWTAVSAVGGEVTSTPGGGGGPASIAAPSAAGQPSSSTATSAPSSSTTTLTTAVVPSSTSTSAPRPATTAPATPTTTAAPPPAARRSAVFDAVGGTLGASCTGAAASLDFATPRGGYAAEVHDAGPEKVDVRFEAEEEGESRLVVRCVDGAPTADVEEHTED